MFSKLLIANRGEIGCRVMRTAKAMGIRTIAIYSDADANAMHVAMADEAVRIGPAPARESYLNIEAVIAAAKQTGADAIHPGYGFLSENAEFAEACAATGIVFVGPPPAAIRAMGLKDRAKALMAKAGVAVVPGYLGDNQSTEHLAKEATKIGYPVLIKAVAGGGGKGMRRVEAAADFEAALASAQREAKSAFGDDRVLIEKYVSRPRHIEVQIFADSHGNTVHLFERDCSLQRRHQKVIEEAPAPGMSTEMRGSLGATAVKAAQAVNYIGAGTVEFVADASDGLHADRIWFMEMNTRLQVEHPVTEAITGLDLVEWQLRVAAGEKLPKQQDGLHINGHAVEARLYAEDPRKGFLPSVGRLERLRFSEDMRVDTGVREGDTVTPFYDPMIAKVIAWSETRESAVAKLARALSETQIAGVHTNAAFLVRALRNPAFVAGDIDTSFIEKHGSELLPPENIPVRAIIETVNFILAERQVAGTDPWDSHDGFRLTGEARERIELLSGDNHYPVEIIHHRGGDASIVVANGTHKAAGLADHVLRLSNGEIVVMENGETHLFSLYDPLESADAAGVATDRIVSPMPGKLIQLLVKAGDAVKRGQPLAVLEAMKMEHTLSAQADAVIAETLVAPGEQVSEGAIILRFKS
jgi:acetyl-CoA carboxylase biotin carboxylase subunit